MKEREEKKEIIKGEKNGFSFNFAGYLQNGTKEENAGYFCRLSLHIEHSDSIKNTSLLIKLKL